MMSVPTILLYCSFLLFSNKNAGKCSSVPDGRCPNYAIVMSDIFGYLALSLCPKFRIKRIESTPNVIS